MSIIDDLKGKLPGLFGQKAALQTKVGPDYFLTQEHIEAIQTIISLRAESIDKQGRSFDDLESDVGVFQHMLFGETDSRDQVDPHDHIAAVCEQLKTLDEDDQKAFLRNVYNLFNNGPMDQKPSFVKWVTKGNVEFETMMLKVHEYNEMLSRHSLKIVGKHAMNDPDSERSQHIRDIVNLIGSTARFATSMRKARTELDTGFGRLFSLSTDAANVAAFKGAEFEEAFTAYIDALPDRVAKIRLSSATDERKQEWLQKIDAAEALLGTVVARQNANDLTHSDLENEPGPAQG